MSSKPSLVERLSLSIVRAKARGRIAQAKRRKILDKLIAVSRSFGKPKFHPLDPLYFNHQGLEISCYQHSARLMDENPMDNYRVPRDYYKISGRPGHPADAKLVREGGINCANIGVAYQGEPVFAVSSDGYMGYHHGSHELVEGGEFIITIYKPGEWENVLEQLYRSEKVQEGLLQIRERKKERKKRKREETLANIRKVIQSLKANFHLHPS